MIGSNVFGTAQDYQTTAGDIYGQMAATTPTEMQAVGVAGTPVNAGQIANVNIGQYMNPYTNQVIKRSEQDIARQREQALNRLGAQASSAGAFGGSRFGLAEGETYGQYGRMAADMAAKQRQQAYNQAMQSAQFDINKQYQADIANRQAEEAAAQREQAARLTNMQAQQSAQRMGLQGLTGLGQTMFGQGMRGLEQQQRAADFAQRQQQMLIDAARQQLLANLGYPQQALQTGAGLLSGFPSQDVNVAGNPGLFDILGAVGSLKGLPF